MDAAIHDAQLSQGRKAWLITGCSSGFGYDLVQAVLAHGDRVIATARRLEDLAYLDGIENARALQLDVTAKESVLGEKVEEAISAFGGIDVLVNNAGYVLSGVWEELNAESTMRAFETNVFGALNLTRVVLAHMRPNRHGTIFFMGSIAGWFGAAGGGGYSATKFALEGAVESLHREVKPFGIRIHLLVIGRFRTNILSKTESTLTTKGIEDYDGIKKSKADNLISSHGKQPGDPLRAVERMVDLARLENLPEKQAADLPLRIPFGSEAVDVLRRECLETLNMLDDWASFAASTDFPTGD